MESPRKEILGLGLLPVVTTLEADKVVRKVTGKCLKNNKTVSGYEIHMGKTRILNSRGIPLLKLKEEHGKDTWTDGCYLKDKEVAGSYIHGILDSPGYRGDFLNHLRRKKKIKERKTGKGRVARFREYDRLADHFEKYCDVDRIISEFS